MDKSNIKDKLKILEDIHQAVLDEELAVPVYTSHIKNTIFWTGLPEAKQKRILEILDTLARESEGHVNVFKRIQEIFETL